MHDYVEQAFNTKTPYTTANLILLIISHLADENGEVSVRQNDIAERCGCGRSTVRDALNFLRDKSLITITTNPGNLPNSYKVTRQNEN